MQKLTDSNVADKHIKQQKQLNELNMINGGKHLNTGKQG